MPSAIARLDGDAVGFFGAVGTRYRGAVGNIPGLAAADVMTDPVRRRLGRASLFVELGLAFFRMGAAAGAPFVFGFPNDRHRRSGERSLGYLPVEPAGEWARPLGTRSLLPRLRRRLLARRVADALSPAHDALAEALHARPGWRSDRSRRTLAWRFAPHGHARYLLVEMVDARRCSRGFAAIRVVEDRALLVDLQALDEKSGDVADLLDAVEEALAGSAARRLVLRAPSGSRLGRRAEEEFGFAKQESDCHFEVRPLDPAFDTPAAARAFDYRFADHEIF
jgi:hypothetical protein